MSKKRKTSNGSGIAGTQPVRDNTNVILPDDPNQPPNQLGDLVRCGTGTDDKCCFNIDFANRACKRQYGAQYGYSQVWAQQALPKDGRPVPNCSTGAPYECHANTNAFCVRPVPYNKDGIYGTMLVNDNPAGGIEDSWCRNVHGPNAIRAFYGDGQWGKCVIANWKPPPQLYPDQGGVGPFPRSDGTLIVNPPVELTNDCCNPVLTQRVTPLTSFCDTQTCFGKPVCDTQPSVQAYCSDRDNITKDQNCIDTCIRQNNFGQQSWCNTPIKNYCVGKNLETETCRQYCSAGNLDSNPELAAFCDNAYTNYCQSKNYSIYDQKRQEQLCGCINSPLPLSFCVDSKCTNNIALSTSRQRQIVQQSGCPNICLQNLVVDGNAIVNIDNLKWQQYCPGVPVPGSNPDKPWEPEKESKTVRLGWLIGAPTLVLLIVLALVFLFRK